MSFEALQKRIDSYSLASFRDAGAVKRYCQDFGIAALCRDIDEDKLASGSPAVLRSVSAAEKKPYVPQFADLCRLHWIALSRKTVSILEFGSGFSTVVLADAIATLHAAFADWSHANLRIVKPFHLHSVEEDQRFLEITQRRLGERLRPHVTLLKGDVEMVQVGIHYATMFKHLPNICPDFLYLDGPSQFAAPETVRGFSIRSPERMPMSADILTFEFFLQPGTLMLIDGRTSNARFLKANLKREWAYRHDLDADIHLFELQESPIGRLNQRQLDFCMNGRWLLDDVEDRRIWAAKSHARELVVPTSTAG